MSDDFIDREIARTEREELGVDLTGDRAELLKHFSRYWEHQWTDPSGKPLARIGLSELADAATLLLIEVDGLRQDAARYRWIEENCVTEGGGHGFTIFVPVDHEDMGCAIDYAMSKAEAA